MGRKIFAKEGSNIAATFAKVVVTFAVILTMVLPFAVKANAAAPLEQKTIDMSQAGNIPGVINESYSGTDFTFVLANASRIKLTLKSDSLNDVIVNLTEDGAPSDVALCSKSVNASNGRINENYSFDLTKGTYHFKVRQKNDNDGSFTLAWTAAEAANESFEDNQGGSNEYFADANVINVNQEYISQLAINDLTDTFMFTLPSAGTVDFTFTAAKEIENMYIRIWGEYDTSSALKNIPYSKNNNLGGEYKNVLNAGTYYVQFNIDYIRKEKTGPVKFKVAFKSAGESFNESGTGQNNSILEANNISLNPAKNYIAAVGENDAVDCFKFTVPKEGQITFNGYTDGGTVVCRIYGPNDYEKTIEYGNTFSKNAAASKSYNVKPGTYAMKLERNGSYSYAIASFNIKFHEHKYTVEKVDYKATEYSDGRIGYYCNVCGLEKESLRNTIYAAKTIKLKSTTATYNKKVFKPAVVVKDRRGKAIASNLYKVTYSSGSKDPGKYKATIKLSSKYYNDVKSTITYEILPVAPTIKSLTASKRILKVSFSKSEKISGYEIQYAFNSKFTGYNRVTDVSSSKTKANITVYGSARGKVYVRMRAYKKTKSYGIVYSKWSKTKTVSVK